jgi:hypothetical protein
VFGDVGDPQEIRLGPAELPVDEVGCGGGIRFEAAVAGAWQADQAGTAHE